MKRIAFAMGALAIAAASHASTVTSTFDAGLTNTDLTNYGGSLAKFDASLGTLTGVSLQMRGGLQGTIHLTLGASQQTTSNVTGVTNSFFDFGSSVSSLNDIFNANSPDLTLTYSSGAVAMAPNSFWDSGVLSKSGSATYDLTSILADLTGTGSFGVDCSSLTGLSVLGGNGFAGGNQTTQASCGATITYTYDAAASTPPSVPEPGSLALIGLALAGLGFTARRKS